MSESKLTRLVKYLVDAQYQGKKLALPTQFDAWIEGGRIEPSSKRINGSGLLAARIYYSGVINIDPCNAPAELIATYVSFWLYNNASQHDSADVEFSADKNEDGTGEVELTIEKFYEDIELIEKPGGPFELDNKQYDFGKQSLWIAEAFTLTGEIDSQC